MGEMVKRASIIIWLVLLLAMTGCGGLKTQTLEQFYGGDLSEVTEIEILSGNTGKEKAFNDKQMIDDFLNKIKNISFIPDEDQRDRDGFNYVIRLYKDEKMIFTFTLTKMKGHYYHTAPEMMPLVNAFYETGGLDE